MLLVAQLAAALALSLVPAKLLHLPTTAQLTAVVHTGDEAEIERVAARLGVVRLAELAHRGNTEERTAALRAIALVDNAWTLLPELVGLFVDEDAVVAQAAARAVRHLSAALSPEFIELNEVPRDLLSATVSALTRVADDPKVAPELRGSALVSLAPLVSPPLSGTQLDRARIERLLSDDAPVVRRNAVELVSLLPASEKLLIGRLTSDPEVAVAAAAGAALCRDVPPTATPGPATHRAAELSEPTRQRLRLLALDEAVPLGDRLELVGCLRVQPSPADQAVLNQLAHHSSDSLARRARSLGGR